MAAKRPDTCYTCHYWEGQGIRQRGPKGVCRRYPPVVTPRHNDGRFPVSVG
jgi:cytochrome c